jgi:hypothetical protein
MYLWKKERKRLAHWQRDSSIYIEALSHPSFLVSSNAAKAAGQLFLACQQAGSHEVPTVAQIMGTIGQAERTMPGVAGPFLQGGQWDLGEWSSFVGDFDLRTWFLDTLRNSPRERRAPHCQTLEFYAHEFFCCDAEAIGEFLRMGRRSLAVLAATENPRCIDKLQSVLESMVNSEDPGISRAIQTYLKERRYSAGIEFVGETCFGI